MINYKHFNDFPLGRAKFVKMQCQFFIKKKTFCFTLVNNYILNFMVDLFNQVIDMIIVCTSHVSILAYEFLMIILT